MLLVFQLARDQLANGVKFTIGGVDVQPSFAGLTATGLYQFNLPIPDLPPGDCEVIAEIGGVRSPSGAFIAIGPKN